MLLIPHESKTSEKPIFFPAILHKATAMCTEVRHLLLYMYMFLKNFTSGLFPCFACKSAVQCSLYIYCMHYTGHLIGCGTKKEIVQYFQDGLCDTKGLLCDKLCNFFSANLHCFTRFQRRKTTLMLCNRQLECKGIMKHLF